MSIAGSYAESVYFETPYEVPGPCKTCCLRCPMPSIIATIVFVGGLVGFCGTTIYAFFLTEDVFPGTLDADLLQSISNWRYFMMVGLIIWGLLNLVLALIMISCSCMGTGATRKEFVCRFKSRAKGRCQTWVMMLVIFILLLIWLGMSVLVLLPLQFFSVQNRGQCLSCNEVGDRITDCSGEIDLTQWALVKWDAEYTKRTISGDDLVTLCDSPVLWWFCSALALYIMVIISLVHYLVNFSANFAKLRDRFKAGYIDRRTGTYLTRSDQRGGGSRASLTSRASGRQARAKRNGTLGRNENMNDATSTISTVHTVGNNGEGEGDEISLTNMNPYYRTANHEENEEPPSYSAQAYDYEQQIKNQDEQDYGGHSRNYRYGDEPTTLERRYGNQPPGRGYGSGYKLNLQGFEDDVPRDDGRYHPDDRDAGKFVTPYHDNENQRDSYHSDNPSLQDQVAHLRARQEYFI